MKNKPVQGSHVYQDGSIELVVLGMLAALIVVLAVPLFVDSPEEVPTADIQTSNNTQLSEL